MAKHHLDLIKSDTAWFGFLERARFVLDGETDEIDPDFHGLLKDVGQVDPNAATDTDLAAAIARIGEQRSALFA